MYNSIPSQDELEHMMIVRHTKPVFEKLKASYVAIAGLGGLGSHIAVGLARAGVGHLLLVDFDRVDLSNLNRQYYNVKHLERCKTEALTEVLLEINPYLHIETACVRVNEQNAVEIFGSYPIVCEAFDNPEAKSILVNCLLSQCPEMQLVAASGMAGWGNSNEIQTIKIGKNFFLCGDQKTGIETGNCLFAPRVSICAGHQANKVLELLLN